MIDVAIRFVMNDVPKFKVWLTLSTVVMRLGVAFRASETVRAERMTITNSVVTGTSLVEYLRKFNQARERDVQAVKPRRKVHARSPHLLSFPSDQARQTTTPSEITN